MKQTKRLSRKQWQFLQRKYKIDTVGVRLVRETKESLIVQLADGKIVEYSKV